ncbi:MAG: hypothetical protein L3J93_00665 [Thermoplasmata archaeon]|nr:hypothetical protein [Thermoplasmata archaeon]
MTDAAAITPLMEQYEGVKARYPGHLVLFRVGDFFETFGDDAKLLAKELEVVLTARAPDRGGARTPMAGVPSHAVDTYLGRLVQKGYKVALCDQVEDARFAKGLVRREVTRVVTPGTVVEERILPGPDHNFLASLLLGEGLARFAVVDVTTGEWYRGEARTEGIEGAVAALAPFAPREILAHASGPDSQIALRTALHRELPNARIEDAPDPIAASEAPENLEIAGDSVRFAADLRLASYVRAAQPRLLPYVSLSEVGVGVPRLVLDAKTLRHLEISRPMNPDDPGGSTLLTTWDETRTPAGRRTLAFWLKHPLADVASILARQEAVAWFVDRGAELLAWRLDLTHISDVARIGARIAGRRIRPTELVSLAESLRAVGHLAGRLREAIDPPPALRALTVRLDPLPELLARLEAAIPKEALGAPEESARFRPGFAPALDGPIAEAARGVADLETLERKEQAASGIRTLKIGFNQVFGY